ncbi:hypothetical protein BIW11_00223 [Tropilaelaps mercedesae]|uniref:Uncharacterized protein n=1 Tax=Tropilaelaps mercedesae TaxID=418985 RepID=A0A1V9XZU9_9ACAR|nr:hypothetical protein BIW11_00223 [Tropilaelaps mercedesae]
MFAKLFVLFALVACAFGGVLKDVTGGTYDLTTGQYSSAITGHVFNSVPVVGAYAAPIAAYGAYGYAAPYAYGGLYI